EDGIRDRNVTGVQTCALPISGVGSVVSRAARRAGRTPRPSLWTSYGAARRAGRTPRPSLWTSYASSSRTSIPTPRVHLQTTAHRSEERRVGKEIEREWCRGRA